MLYSYQFQLDPKCLRLKRGGTPGCSYLGAGLRGQGNFIKMSRGVHPLNSHYCLVLADFSQDNIQFALSFSDPVCYKPSALHI